MTPVIKSKCWKLIVLALPLFGTMHSVHANDFAAQTIGEAFDLKSDEPLYSETHCLSSDALAREVIYRNVDGKLIAHKVLSYKTGPTTPSFVQHNFYAGESIRVELKQDKLTMTVEEKNSTGPGRVISRYCQVN